MYSLARELLFKLSPETSHELSIDLIGVVPEDSELALTTDRGVPAAYNRRLYVNQAYRNIAQRIIGNNVPLMNFQKPGFWGRLWRWFRR